MAFQIYNGSWVEDFLEESSTQLPSVGPTLASLPTDNQTAVTWGSVGGVVAVLTAASAFLVAARRKLESVDRLLSRIQGGLAAALGFFSRRQAQNDASTSPMSSPGDSGATGFRNATDSDQIEMRRCARGGGRTMWV